MKKLILACGVTAAMLSGATACGGSSAAPQPKTAEDSLSCVIGEFNGSQLNMNYDKLPADMKAKFNKAEILKAIKDVIMTDTASQSYITGMQIGLQLWSQIYQMQSAGVKVDPNMVYNAYAAAFNADSVGDMSAIASRYQMAMTAAQKRMMEFEEEKAKAAEKAKAESPEAKKNAQDGAAYIAKMKNDDPSVKTTASGLAYKVVKEGEGTKPASNSTVNVKYVGKHIDGKEFDSNDNAKFPVQGVIPGFAEGLQLMAPGAHYILYIPGSLAYGVNGTPDGSIGPDETLVFDVELLSVDAK